MTAIPLSNDSVVGANVYLLGGTNSESASKSLSGLYVLDTGMMNGIILTYMYVNLTSIRV